MDLIVMRDLLERSIGAVATMYDALAGCEDSDQEVYHRFLLKGTVDDLNACLEQVYDFVAENGCTTAKDMRVCEAE